MHLILMRRKHSPHVGILAVSYQMFIMSTLGPAPKLTLRHERSKKKKNPVTLVPQSKTAFHQAASILPIIAVFYRCAELCLRLFFISS